MYQILWNNSAHLTRVDHSKEMAELITKDSQSGGGEGDTPPAAGSYYKEFKPVSVLPGLFQG